MSEATYAPEEWGMYLRKPATVRAARVTQPREIHTATGNRWAKVGDWLLESLPGAQLAVVDDEVFQLLYAPVEVVSGTT